jgi:methionyl-tRNA formyltransferase
MPRIVFFGSDAIAVPALEYLQWAEGVELVGMVSQPNRPAGRGRHLHANAVAAWAAAKGVPLLQPEKPGAEEAAWLRAQRVDLALVMAYGHILRRELLEAAPRGMWNLHASLLPKYRGASPVETALACGEKQTGVTLMRMAEKMDAGAVAGMETVAILPTDTGAILRERVAQACVPLLQRHLQALGDGSIKTEVQDESRVTYTRKLTKADAQLDWSSPAKLLAYKVRAFLAWPGTQIEHGGQVIKIGAASAIEETTTLSPGTILRANAAGVDVATGAGVLRLLQLQRAGGRMLDVGEFLRGYPIAAGEILPGHALRPLVAERPFPKSG